MVFVGILIWWYTDGYRQALRRIQARLVGLFDYFSVDILIKTLFSPFRQISAGRVDGPLPVQLRAFGDRLLSRVIGAVVRLIVMCIGIVTILLATVLSVGYIIFWAMAPLIPIIALSLTLLGWIPWTLI